MKIFLEGIPIAMHIAPVVLQDMQSPVNLSLEFVQKNELAIVGENKQLHVKHQGYQIPLRGSRRVLDPLESCDPRFDKLLQYIRKFETVEVRERTRGLYYSGGHLGWAEAAEGQRATVSVIETTQIPAYGGRWVAVNNTGQQDGESAVDPTGCPAFQDHSSLKLGRTLVSWRNGESKLLVLNLSDKSRELSGGQSVGYSFPVEIWQGESNRK